MWVTDGPVRAIAHSGNTIYVGGSFFHVGRYTGGGATLDGAGKPLANSPVIDGSVVEAVSDGSGGWYLGGTFGAVGGIERSNLAHVLADGSVDSWNPHANAGVTAMAVSAGTIYVGGGFTSVGGATRNYVAALDATTGTALAWDPNANGGVAAIAVGAGGVFVGGRFTSIGGQARTAIAQLDPLTGAATSWVANASGGFPGPQVFTLAVNGNTVYLGGQFSNIGGVGRGRIAAVDATTESPRRGTRTRSQPVCRYSHRSIRSPSPAAPCTSAACSTTSAAPFRIDRRSGCRDRVGHWMESEREQCRFVPGGERDDGLRRRELLHHRGQFRDGIAAINAGTGLSTAWNPTASGYVATLAVDGATVYAGGYFDMVGGVARSRLAALDATTGTATAWNPGANDSVYTLAVDEGTVYAGGAFSLIGGQLRPGVAALDGVTGSATSWIPGVNNGRVRAIAVSGTTVYVGGEVWISVQPRYVAALDRATGAVRPWNAALNGLVLDLALSGNIVYAGGEFTQAGVVVRNHLAAFDTTGATISWDPNSDFVVDAIAASGSTVYAGGSFLNVGGASRSFMAALDAATGLATDWNPLVNGRVRDVAVMGSRVYVGGEFTSVRGRARSRFAALTPFPAPSNLDPGMDSTVDAVAAGGGSVFAGGAYRRAAGATQLYLAAMADTFAIVGVAGIPRRRAFDCCPCFPTRFGRAPRSALSCPTRGA